MKLYRILFCLIILSCSQNLSKERKEKLWEMMKSDNVNTIFNAVIEIQKAKDTSMIEAVLYKPNDPRITNTLFRKGMSVYQVKMVALEKITNIAPPKQITYEVDTAIINFYIEKLRH